MRKVLKTSTDPMTVTSNVFYFLFTNFTLTSTNDTIVDDEGGEPLRRTTGELVVGTLTFVVITLMTIGGNILVILSVFTYRPLNKVQNYFLVSLAASDLAVAVLVTPFHVVKFNVGEWIFGLAFCQLWLTCDILCCTASILNLCAIALDRYWAIHDPIEYSNKRTLKLVLIMIAIVWSLSVLISVPPLIGWNDWSKKSLQRQCELTTQREFVVYSAFGSFFIPLIVMTTVYVKIFLAARQRLRNKRRSFRGLSTNSRGADGSQKRPRPAVPQQLSPSQPAATESTALDPVAQGSGTGQSGGGADAALVISPLTPGSELSERTTLLKEPLQQQQNGDNSATSAIWSALKAASSSSGNQSPVSLTAATVPPPKPLRRFKKFAIRSGSNASLKSGSRQASVRGRGDKDETQCTLRGNATTSGPGHGLNVQKFMKDRERISVTKEKKAAKTLAVIMGVFVLCWLPFFVMYLVKPFVDKDAWQRVLHPKVEEAITWLGYINSAINPVIYTIFNLDFRRAFQKFLCPFRPSISA